MQHLGLQCNPLPVRARATVCLSASVCPDKLHPSEPPLQSPSASPLLSCRHHESALSFWAHHLWAFSVHGPALRTFSSPKTAFARCCPVLLDEVPCLCVWSTRVAGMLVCPPLPTNTTVLVRHCPTGQRAPGCSCLPAPNVPLPVGGFEPRLFCLHSRHFPR